eukprot:CAMPEP_0175053370 /NCGR_PEP_ID=MMETSP0052_2-20121109/8884_1 /TAXON_ID=51329 ORGANISM="Polytomella parva, Strain SAG 63-3" /NCGR_SAMPLE_ID=MMETSP0052_2 /ASSEMBLY_ACC=CAM_ASM_000194 /LENGTH=285 /DNA_ID=CAMNT_0016317891 /DNA_START=417 /DNA_END=1274 /DNA_ORIENTATION=-
MKRESHFISKEENKQIIVERKKDLRKFFREKLRLLSEQVKELESEKISTHILASLLFQTASSICIYAHSDRLHEVRTSTLLEATLASGKTLYLPVVVDRASKMKLLHVEDLSCLRPVLPFGILEPPDYYVSSGLPRIDALSTAAPLDLVILPGLAFSADGSRLGRGGGYYDLAMSTLKQQALLAGRPPPVMVSLAYTDQMVSFDVTIPLETHDERMDVVVTASGGATALSVADRHAKMFMTSTTTKTTLRTGWGGGEAEGNLLREDKLSGKNMKQICIDRSEVEQ